MVGSRLISGLEGDESVADRDEVVAQSLRDDRGLLRLRGLVVHTQDHSLDKIINLRQTSELKSAQ